MEKEFLSIDDVSKYLGIKRSTLYLKVERHGIPFYRFGRLIRFKKEDLDLWIEHFKHEVSDPNSKAKEIFKPIEKQPVSIERIVKRSIEDVLEKRYTPNYGRPDQAKGRRKEVGNGTL